MKRQKNTRKNSSNSRNNVLEILEGLGYCTGCTEYRPNPNFCLNCGKPIAPKVIRKSKEKKKFWRIVCPYCGKDYDPNYYEKHIKTMHSNAILRHFK